MNGYEKIIKKGLASQKSVFVEIDLTEPSVSVKIKEANGKIVLGRDVSKRESSQI